MTQDGGYPAGAQYDPLAPYNQEDKTKEVEVTISVTMSITRTIDVPAETEHWAEGEYDIKDFVEEQVDLPFEKFPDWCVDDYTVVEE